MIPKSRQAFFMLFSSCSTVNFKSNLLSFSLEIVQAWIFARSSSHTQFFSSLWERARKHLHAFGVHEGRYRNTTLCNYWVVMALFLNYIFQASQHLHLPKSSWCKPELSCKMIKKREKRKKKNLIVGDLPHGLAYLGRTEWWIHHCPLPKEKCASAFFQTKHQNLHPKVTMWGKSKSVTTKAWNEKDFAPLSVQLG